MSMVAAVPAAALVVACSSPGGAAIAGQPGQSPESVTSSHAAATPGSATRTPSSAARRASASPSAAAPRTSVPPPVPAAAAVASGKRLVTFVNKVSQTIWVAAAQNPAHPLVTTGWVLPAGQSLTIAVPENVRVPR